MKVTFSQLLRGLEVCSKIFNTQIDHIPTAFKAGRVNKKLEGLNVEWQNVLRDLVVKYGEEMEDGNYKYPQEGTEEFGQFNEELNEMLAIENELDVEFSVELLEEIQENSDGLTLSASDIGRIEWLLE